MSGGEQPVVAPKLTHEEVRARLIKIGEEAFVPNPHTVLVVQDAMPLEYSLEKICCTMPVAFFEIHQYSLIQLQHRNIAFFPYKYKEEAENEASKRIVKMQNEMMNRENNSK